MRNHRPKQSGKRTNRSAYRPQRLKESRSAARVGPITAADETDVKLKFIYSSYMTNAAGGIMGKEWTPNAAYDVDPALGSTATNGFDAYALLYSYYRVIGYRYDVEVVNRENDAIVAYLLNTNTSVTGTSIDIYSANPYCQTRQLGRAAGGTDSTRFQGYITCSKLLGSIEAETDATTRALTTGVPSDLLLMSLFIQANNSVGTLVSGASYVVKITMDVRFYGRIYNATLSTMTERIKHIEEQAKMHKESKIQKSKMNGKSVADSSASPQTNEETKPPSAEDLGHTITAQISVRELVSFLTQAS